jgi:hypothetical protein
MILKHVVDDRQTSWKTLISEDSWLTRNFPAYTHNVKFETDFFSYDGKGPPEMFNDCNLQWTYQSSTIRQHRCETNAHGDHLDKFRQNLELICRQLTSLPTNIFTNICKLGDLRSSKSMWTTLKFWPALHLVNWAPKHSLSIKEPILIYLSCPHVRA